MTSFGLDRSACRDLAWLIALVVVIAVAGNGRPRLQALRVVIGRAHHPGSDLGQLAQGSASLHRSVVLSVITAEGAERQLSQFAVERWEERANGAHHAAQQIEQAGPEEQVRSCGSWLVVITSLQGFVTSRHISL